MWYERRGLYRNADAGAGGGVAAAAGAASGAADAGAAGTNGSAAAAGAGANGTAPAAFDWKSLNLDPGLQNVVDAHQWKDVGSAINSYAHLQTAMGIKSGAPDRLVILPSDKDGPEAWEPVYTKLGRPEKAADYKLPVPEGDKGEFASRASEWFHKAGISRASGIKLAEQWNAHVAEQSQAAIAAATAKAEAEITGLKAEWGANYDSNLELVDKAAVATGASREVLAAMKQTMGPAAALKFFHGIGMKLGVEGKFIDGAPMTPDGKLPPAQAAAEIAKLKTDRAFIEQFNSKDPQVRSAARQKMDNLHRAAYPGSSEIKGRT